MKFVFPERQTCTEGAALQEYLELILVYPFIIILPLEIIVTFISPSLSLLQPFPSDFPIHSQINSLFILIHSYIHEFMVLNMFGFYLKLACTNLDILKRSNVVFQHTQKACLAELAMLSS